MATWKALQIEPRSDPVWIDQHLVHIVFLLQPLHDPTHDPLGDWAKVYHPALDLELSSYRAYHKRASRRGEAALARAGTWN